MIQRRISGANTGRSGPSERSERVTERLRVLGTQRRARREACCEERADAAALKRGLERRGASSSHESTGKKQRGYEK